MKHLIVAIWLAGLAFSALGQEYMPYPRELITPEQWQNYFDQVRAKYSPETGIPEEFKLTLFLVEDNATLYAFTRPGHPAHPAWIRRDIYEDKEGVKLRMIGYFAGNEGEFKKLWRQYEELNRQMEEEMRTPPTAKKPGKPSN